MMDFWNRGGWIAAGSGHRVARFPSSPSLARTTPSQVEVFSLACLVFSVRPPVSHLAPTSPHLPSPQEPRIQALSSSPVQHCRPSTLPTNLRFFSYSRLGFDYTSPPDQTKRLAPPCVSSQPASDNGATSSWVTNRLPEHGFGS